MATPSEFKDIDRAADPGACLAYLDTISAQRSVQEYKRHSFALLDLGPGLAVLDVGCGTGDDARLLAGCVAPGGRVVGLDSSEAAVAEARSRSDGGALPIEFHLGDAHELPFESGTFDAVRADRVLVHLRDPARAMAEVARVTRPGRPVVAMDSDWETLIVDSPDRAVTRRILNAHVDTVPHSWIGRHLPALFAGAGLEVVQIVPVVFALTTFDEANQFFGLAGAAETAAAGGAVSGDEAKRWLDQLERADQEDRFFSGLTAFIVAGCKPAPTARAARPAAR